MPDSPTRPLPQTRNEHPVFRVMWDTLDRTGNSVLAHRAVEDYFDDVTEAIIAAQDKLLRCKCGHTPMLCWDDYEGEGTVMCEACEDEHGHGYTLEDIVNGWNAAVSKT